MEYYKNLSLEDLFYINDDGLVCCEEWRSVIGYEEIYEVSDLGRIKSLSRYRGNGKSGYVIPDRIRRQSLDSDGYLLVSLYIKGVSQKLKAHRITAQAFIPNPENKPEVNHKKGIKTDNRVSELEWNTEPENKKHALENGLMVSGEKHPNSKLTEIQVLEIRASKLSHVELSLLYNTNRTNIIKIVNRQRWRFI